MTIACPVWTEDADFFWNRCGDVDNRPCGVVFGGVIQTIPTPAVRHGLQRVRCGR